MMTTQHSLEELIGYEGDSVESVLEKINTNAQGICFLINAGKQLVGVVTDGDIRRGFLKGVTLGTRVNTIMQREFVALPVTSSITSIQAKLSDSIRCIPLVDEQLKIVDYAGWHRLHQIPVMEPQLDGNELEYVTECLKTGWISSQGKFVRQLESVFGEYCDMPYALAVSNGTVALHLALVALGIGPGDEVIVPDMTFAASINAVIYTGATPVIVDVTRDTWTIDPFQVEKAITAKTKAIMPVHLYGHPCHMDELIAIAQQHALFIIEDCAEALGSLYKGRSVGSMSDVATFSFYGNKTITTGEGGMIVIKDRDIYERALVLRDHGMSKERRYWHDVVGYNYRMTNVQAAIGVAQMERIDAFVEHKRRIARTYTELLTGLMGIEVPPEESWAFNSYWLYTFLINDKAGIARDEMIIKLLKNGVESRRAFYPLHKMPPYKKFVKESSSYVNSIMMAEQGMSLPSSVGLTEEVLTRVANNITRLLTSSSDRMCGVIS